MLVPALLVVAQLAVVSVDSTYSSQALAKLVSMASQTNRRVPQPLVGYDARIESEIALLLNNPTGPEGNVAGTAAATTEAAAQIEQFQLAATWNRSGTFQQHLIGYRARQLGPMVSALSIVPRPWTAPTLYGDRLSLTFGGGPSFRASDSARRMLPSVHPFAADRDVYYRFTGGDTVVKIRSAARVISVARVDVEPRPGKQQVMVFAGQIFVDAATGDIVRMRGLIRLMAPPGESPLTRMARFIGQVREMAYIDFENSEHDGRFWIPRKQRIEYQVITGLTEARATVRVQSTWRDVRLALRAVADVSADDTLGAPRYTLDQAPADSAATWEGWRYDLGAQTTEVSARDFDDVAPPALRPDGPMQWRWQSRGFTDVIRFNRVEGLYLGATGLLEFRQAAPGLAIRFVGGWAASAGEAKGGLEAAQVMGRWVATLRGERQLASTNDLSLNGGARGGNILGSLFGREDFDWVDRRTLAVGMTREFGGAHASAVRTEIGAVSDRAFPTVLEKGPLGGTFRPNRPVNVGHYVRSRIELNFNRNIVTNLLASGIGATMTYERGDGQLDWQRLQLLTLVQRTFGRLVLGARTDGAVVVGANAPVQQLLEIGGAEGLPGYSYKAFAGDQAIVVRSTAAFLLPFLESPTRLHRVVLPAIAPQLQVGIFGGRTVATHNARPTLDQLGWVASNGWRGTLDLRLRFFGGAFSTGAARAFDHRDRWRLIVGVGGSL